MHIELVGISHQTALVSVRERFAFAPEELPAALPRFGGAAVLLSTCNRTEVYLASHHVITAPPVVSLLQELKGDTDTPHDAFYHSTGLEAARHLFRVAAGIESMVLGESEILGQVRSAFAAATAAHTHNAVLSQLFHSAIRVGRKARNQTAIGRHSVSISSTAVSLAREIVGDLSARTVLVVSAGEAGKLAARSLVEHGAPKLLVTNRSAARARELAGQLGGRTIAFSHLGEAMAKADIVISSSAAPDYLIDRDATAQAVAGRNGRPLLLIDIAVPRDIDPAARDLPGVHLYDIDDLQERVDRNRNNRQQEVAEVEHLVEQGVRQFAAWMRSRGVVPTIAALRSRAEMLREAELSKTFRRMRDLTPDQRAGVEAMASALVKKLLHDPIDRLKGDDGERYAATVRDIFALDADDETSKSETNGLDAAAGG